MQIMTIIIYKSKEKASVKLAFSDISCFEYLLKYYRNEKQIKL